MHRVFYRAATASLLLAVFAAPSAAQSLKDDLLDDFRRMRANVIMMVEAMPDDGLRSAPTDDVRDFAQQIEHVVQGSVSIVGSGVDRPVEGMGDADVYLNSKAELINFVNGGFDQVDAMIESWTMDDLRSETSLFGQAQVTKRKLAQTAYEHGVWTLGATVPYVRLQGGAPAGYDLIPRN
jgi:DinB superfamily